MDGWLLAIAVKPWALFALFAVVVCVEIVLRRVIPDSRAKSVLFDPTFVKRRPALFIAIWVALMAVLWWWIASTYFTPELGFH